MANARVGTRFCFFVGVCWLSNAVAAWAVNPAQLFQQTLTAIVPGQAAREAEYPFVGKVPLDRFQHLCTAVVIGPRLVLTAAHCLQTCMNRLPYVVFRGPSGKEYNARVVQDSSFRVSPPCSPDLADYEGLDLAALVTREEILESTPIPIGSPGSQDSFGVLGYGKPTDDRSLYFSALRLGTLTWPTPKAKRRLNFLTGHRDWFLYFSPAPDHVHSGDSGGAVFATDVTGHPTLIGITVGHLELGSTHFSAAIDLQSREAQAFLNRLKQL